MELCGHWLRIVEEMRAGGCVTLAWKMLVKLTWRCSGLQLLHNSTSLSADNANMYNHTYINHGHFKSTQAMGHKTCIVKQSCFRLANLKMGYVKGQPLSFQSSLCDGAQDTRVNTEQQQQQFGHTDFGIPCSGSCSC